MLFHCSRLGTRSGSVHKLHSTACGTILSKMPMVTSHHWIFHCHFSLLVCQSPISPECTISLLPLTQHKIYAHEELSGSELQAVEEDILMQGSSVMAKTLIPKPHREISRTNRGGYNLQEKLGWPVTDYEEI